MFDVFHLQIMEGDIITRLEKLLPMIGHVQIAAVPSRAEPDEGEINYRAVFDALERIGYDGVVGARIPAARRDQGRAGVDAQARSQRLTARMPATTISAMPPIVTPSSTSPKNRMPHSAANPT